MAQTDPFTAACPLYRAARKTADRHGSIEPITTRVDPIRLAAALVVAASAAIVIAAATVTPESAAEDRRQLDAWRANQGRQPDAPPRQLDREAEARVIAAAVAADPIAALFSGILGKRKPPAPTVATFAPPPSGPELMRLQREEALLAGSGTIHAMQNCSHGTPGYALLYLEWQGLMRRTEERTGPLPMDRHARFTLTAEGEAARDALLRVGIKGGQ